MYLKGTETKQTQISISEREMFKAVYDRVLDKAGLSILLRVDSLYLDEENRICSYEDYGHHRGGVIREQVTTEMTPEQDQIVRALITLKAYLNEN